VTRPSVLIVDDHDIVRVALESLMLASPDLTLAGSAATLARALALVAELQPDLVITDMSLPDSRGLDTVRAIAAAQDGRKTLVVSMQDELVYAELALSHGASGYLMKESAHANVMQAAASVLRGEQWVSEAVRAKLLEKMLHRHRSGPSAEDHELTARELQVMEQIRGGKTTKEIAASLGISVRTVDLYRASIKRKLHLRTGVEVVAYAFNRM
jgi:DNA-binding NarL/FixJ family response regulator